MSTQAPVGAQEMPLLSTKLYIPTVRREQILRPRLIERLDAGLQGKLTLVSAPAGFGKTTVVSEWVQGREGVAWVSLDAGDSTPARFWRYVIAALQGIGLVMQTTLAIWKAQQGNTELLLASLINEVADAAQGDSAYLLVLDDYHLVDTTAGQASEIHNGVEYLLDHLPPALHLVLITRQDPPFSLARLRGRRQLVEIRARDLRFTPQETAELLNVVMGLGLSTDEITALERRTEGWIVGLQMSALSLQGQTGSERERFVAAFAGDDRYVADYLIDEVLRRQPTHIQRFLVETSILDRLCGPLCDAILQDMDPVAWMPDPQALVERRASPSQAILEHLLESNLFVVSLDSRHRWFRYHRLFAELLHSRLIEHGPGRAAENHLRASKWYDEQGLGPEAISHALGALDYDRAADLVERYGARAIRYGELWLHRQWIDALPEATVRARPMLCMARAWALLFDSDAPERSDLEWIERALELSAAAPRPLSEPVGGHRTDHSLIRETAYVFRVGHAQFDTDPAQMVDLCLEALERLPEEAAFGRGFVALWLARAYARLNEGEAARRALAQARQIGLAAEGHLIPLVIAGNQASNAWSGGDLHAVARICREAMASLVEPAEQAGERIPQACHAYVYLGRTLVEWNELEQAEPLLLRGIELAELALAKHLYVDGCRDLALLHWIQREYEEAHAWMDKAVQACTGDPAFLHALRARIWLAQAEEDPRWLETAIQWAGGRALEASEGYDWELQTLVRVRIAQYRARGEPDLAPILALLDQRLADQPLSSSGWRVQNLALRALLLQALGRTEEALSPLKRAIEVAERAGWMLAFVEHGPPMYELLQKAARQVSGSYVRKILNAFEVRGRAEVRTRVPRAPALTSQVALVEPLTERELQVLRLLATTLSGPEIADQLTISLSTLRTHTKNIRGKLGAHSRLDAISRAAELGLLPGQSQTPKAHDDQR